MYFLLSPLLRSFPVLSLKREQEVRKAKRLKNISSNFPNLVSEPTDPEPWHIKAEKLNLESGG